MVGSRSSRDLGDDRVFYCSRFGRVVLVPPWLSGDSLSSGSAEHSLEVGGNRAGVFIPLRTHAGPSLGKGKYRGNVGIGLGNRGGLCCCG